ncbi:MAG: hypothetical protein R2932_27405 [Caldilineaceae bacterium]
MQIDALIAQRDHFHAAAQSHVVGLRQAAVVVASKKWERSS